ncbi:rop guanine nucleotide exchange factor 14 [Beta vulgaris subsp. vulgaris]|uniref:rop guanine nucleotide exchange factor 14 n=1 Tax=Beta vulgaris subsp. vulgaris TaxID=3555 RepID=UPI002036B833|nr:rop guanine nucleotide exchange factor 14 [Beta vulgaris subsp. vulgaris]XP_010676687.2 rop guanine nucleotide exchange factor 14 [Beta vulgaris subsp. vulgaris]
MRMGIRRRLACCTRDREISIDFDENEHDRIMTYDGLESCIINSHLYTNEGTISGENVSVCQADSITEEETSCSSSKNTFGSCYSDWTTKRNQEETDEWSSPESTNHTYVREKPDFNTQFTDVEAMKEKFAKLLLGEDVTGGRKGISSALAISNSITSLAASVFGELWKLEPLPEETRAKWKQEMDWLLSPANYMVDLVPAKQSGANGRNFEIMTPKARADVHVNLPALQKIDSMLIEFLDSMVTTEFWYAEGNSRKEGRGGSERQSKRWWLPSPRVPAGGLSETARKKLLSQGNMVLQLFKAAKSINENVLLEMPVPKDIQDALPKSGRANLGEEVYKVIASGSSSALEIVDFLKLGSEHEALETINKLEAAALAWRERIKEQISSTKTLNRTSWPFMKEPIPEVNKAESLLLRAEALLYQLKMRYPCLPHTFFNVIKIQYGKDIGHSILEAYSRVLGNLAYSILARIGDILQEDHSSNPNSPVPTSYFSSGSSLNGRLGSPIPIANPRIRHSLVERMNKSDGYFSDSNPSRSSDSEISSSTEAKSSSVTATPSSSRIWCIGKDAYSNASPGSSSA